MSMKFKLGIAVFFAIIAALTAMIAGLVSDARISIVLLRTVCSFFVTGVLVYIGAFLFEHFSYQKLIKATEEAMDELSEEQEVQNDGDDAKAEEGENEAEESSAENGFQPLETDGLKHMVTDNNN